MSDDATQTASAFIPVEPFDLVIFGGTGDLAQRKLIPSLYHRYRDEQIPESSRIIAVSRSKIDDAQYAKDMREAYDSYGDPEAFDDGSWAAFSDLLAHVAVEAGAEDEDWSALQALLAESEKTRVFYLATPPAIYADIATGLQSADLVTDGARVVLEKPLGHDRESADTINDGVGQVFAENRVYRIDHYLGKETVQNLLVLRFGNVLLEPLWNNRHVDHIQITAAEPMGVAGRGGYYDKAGALRDMVQNHLMQLLCLTCMEVPISLGEDDVRAEKLKVIRALEPITAETVKDLTVRGQYARGEIDGEGVSDYLTDAEVDKSKTETYVAIRAEIENWRWSGVPIYLRTGKRMAHPRNEVVIQFKPVPHSVFSDTHINPNRLVIRIQPEEAVTLWMEIKEPGAGGMRLKTLPLNLTYADNFTVRYPDAYERLLMDVVRGNLSLFMRRDEVDAAWKWIDSIVEAWEASEQRVELYAAGDDGPPEGEDMLAREGRTWAENMDVRRA